MSNTNAGQTLSHLTTCHGLLEHFRHLQAYATSHTSYAQPLFSTSAMTVIHLVMYIAMNIPITN